MTGREAEGDKHMRKATQLCGVSFLELRFRPEWNAAAPLFEQAARVYQVGKYWQKAKVAFEKTAACQAQLGSPWHAGKMYDKAAEMAKEQGDLDGMTELFVQAAESFFEAGRPVNGLPTCHITQLEGIRPEKARELYAQAMDVLEQDERFTFGPDLYRSAVAHELTQGQFDKAAEILLKFAAICAGRNLSVSVCRSYLGVVVIWLHEHDLVEAERVMHDASAVGSFVNSQEQAAGEELLSAYRSNDPEAVKKVVAESVSFQFLDAAVGRLAQKLPTQEMNFLAQETEEDLT